MTSGSSFKANGGVEGEMNVIKTSIRTLISANVGTLTKQGPLAARHIGQWGNPYVLGQRCENPGKPGTCPWRDTREEAKILGPDINSSLTNIGYTS